MKELNEIIRQHQRRYPRLELVDLVKLIYQNEFGVGHFIADEKASLARLEAELQGLSYVPGELFEPIGAGLYRLRLQALGDTLSPATVNRFFLLTAQREQGTIEGFREKLQILQAFYPGDELDSFLQEYQAAGYPPLSHSPSYKEHYAPSYRVVKGIFAQFLPVFEQIEKRLAQSKERLTVAIDGRSGGGKSSLGQLLQDVYACPVISMDHFFLRPEQRSPARLAEAGGNVDYERFSLEVSPHLREKTPFQYQIYSCQTQTFTPSPLLDAHRLIVVEGSYSHHPLLAADYDLKVFLTVSPEEQRERIVKRNGPVMLERFVNEWIPLEELYFSTFAIQEKSDIVLHTDQEHPM
mgnify:FL=1